MKETEDKMDEMSKNMEQNFLHLLEELKDEVRLYDRLQTLSTPWANFNLIINQSLSMLINDNPKS